jgi:hypothetical protein
MAGKIEARDTSTDDHDLVLFSHVYPFLEIFTCYDFV